jgi:hypothetical protein
MFTLPSIRPAAHSRGARTSSTNSRWAEDNCALSHCGVTRSVRVIRSGRGPYATWAGTLLSRDRPIVKADVDSAPQVPVRKCGRFAHVEQCGAVLLQRHHVGE